MWLRLMCCVGHCDSQILVCVEGEAVPPRQLAAFVRMQSVVSKAAVIATAGAADSVRYTTLQFHSVAQRSEYCPLFGSLASSSNTLATAAAATTSTAIATSDNDDGCCGSENTAENNTGAVNVTAGVDSSEAGVSSDTPADTTHEQCCDEHSSHEASSHDGAVT
jgi:hypothetical protein